MIWRILPPEEWPRLKGTEAGEVWPLYDPERTQVVVVEDAGKIVATWTVMQTVTVECLWADPAYRGSFGVTKRLLAGMRAVAKALGVSHVQTASQSEHVTDLIRRFGGIPIPAEFFSLPVDMVNAAKRANRLLGRSFHDQIEASIPEDHPYDPVHDEQVGRAMRAAIEGKDPERAESEYNEWAEANGYDPVKFLGEVDGRLRMLASGYTIDVGKDYRVTVVEEVCQ